MTQPVYINDLSVFLPNQPVLNSQIEDVLGRINEIPSLTKKTMLANNKIEKRYYAIDPSTGKFTHNNAQLTARAVQKLLPYPGFTPGDIQVLSCGTTSPDVILPGHGMMVAGELGVPPCEVVSTSGICLSGMTALKYAQMSIASGASTNGVCTGSELSSSFMRADFFTLGVDPDADIAQAPILAFNADFLRWMLSDGAGAAYLANTPNPRGISLKIEWIDMRSYAGELATCMYAGGKQNKDGSISGWREAESCKDVVNGNLLAVKQDTQLLGRHIVNTMGQALESITEKRQLRPEDVNWYLPHYSSHYFRAKFYQVMKEIGFEIPYEKWFTNLPYTGNVGSASIYIIMEELFKSGKLKKGEKLLCFIPESGRFSHCFMLLTVVQDGR
ncbi:MAG: beta-ketoacyl-ACP synthase III [Desulfobacterales bacterium]|nr:beta-ketoacyl-ACP synthase III [Desulfobacterales bacterium]